MTASNSDSHEDVVKWAAEREAHFSRWEAELKAKQQSLDLQEARLIALKAKFCSKCQAECEASSSSAEIKPPLPRGRMASPQNRTMPLPIGTSSPVISPTPTPTSPSAGPRVASPSASMRTPRPALSSTPMLPASLSKVPPGASASVRLPLRSPPPLQSAATDHKMSSSASTPVLANNNISSEVASFLAEHKKTAEVGLGSFPGCVKEGFMIKKGAKVKNWKRRYFVLQVSGKLMYFENCDGRKLLGQLQVTSESSVGVRGNGGEGEEGGLWVCPEPNGRIYEFETGDADSRDKWITALNSLIGPINMPRQWKQKAPEKPEKVEPYAPRPLETSHQQPPPLPSGKPKIRIVVQIPGSFFRNGEEQAMEASIYTDETAADVVQRSMKLVTLIPGLQRDKLLSPLALATTEGEILEPSQIVHPISVVVLQEA